MQHMFMPVVITAAIVLAVFYMIDSYYYKREDQSEHQVVDKTPFSIQGKVNFIFLGGIVAGVLLSGF